MAKTNILILPGLPDILRPIQNFSEQVTQLQLENAVIIKSVSKLWREHYDQEYIQNEAFINDVDRIVENDFKSLYQSTIISLFTYLETAIKDLLLELIIYFYKNDNVEIISELANINISLIEFMKLDESQKYRYIANIYEKQQGGSAPYGIARFEKLLRPFKLDGTIDKNVKKAINELAQTRNNIIHKSGIVDDWFMKHCPWLFSKYKIGDHLIINYQELDIWIESTITYCNQIQKRLIKRFE